MRLEKEIVMLRQLLDNAIPENASSYLTLVSEGLREIEEVSYIRSKHRANMYYAVFRIISLIVYCVALIYLLAGGNPLIPQIIFDYITDSKTAPRTREKVGRN